MEEVEKICNERKDLGTVWFDTVSKCTGRLWVSYPEKGKVMLTSSSFQKIDYLPIED